MQDVFDVPARRAKDTPCRGGVMAEARFKDVLEREIRFIHLIRDWIDVESPAAERIEAALGKAKEVWGSVTVHDRLIPGNLGLPEVCAAIYAFNDWCKDKGRQQAGRIPIKLSDEPGKEWWRMDRDVQYLPSETGLLCQDLAEAMRPTDLAGRPFFLNATEQELWVREQGRGVMTSVEETLYLFLRSAYEFGRPLWAAGWARGRNNYGSAGRLRVHWHAGWGLSVSRWRSDERNWSGGCLARKFVAADAILSGPA